MAATVTAATGWPAPSRTCRQASSTPADQACAGSCSKRSGDGATSSCGMRHRASTSPSSPAATAFTEVVPMSIPTVTPPTPATVPPIGTLRAMREASGDKPVALVTAPLRGPALDELREHVDVVLEPWIDQVPDPPLRRRAARRPHRRARRHHRDLRGRQLLGARARPAARRHRLDPGRPHQRRPGRRHGRGHPRAARPGAQRRRGGRAHRRPAARRDPPRPRR